MFGLCPGTKNILIEASTLGGTAIMQLEADGMAVTGEEVAQQNQRDGEGGHASIENWRVWCQAQQAVELFFGGVHEARAGKILPGVDFGV